MLKKVQAFMAAVHLSLFICLSYCGLKLELLHEPIGPQYLID
ncbi:hypothetical protein DB29_04283 [Shouchella clausii]|nr:hypothetical protein DB29_04283 [Shouchella clausii]